MTSRPTSRRSSTTAALILAVGLLVTGCSDADGDATRPTSASGPTYIDTPGDVFGARSPWRRTVLDDAVDPRSARMLEPSAPGAGGLQVDTREWTVPVVTGGVPTVLTCRQVACGDATGELTLDVPAATDPDPRYDGWFTIVDADARTAYDLRRARREADGTISYQFLRTWDLDGPGFSQPYVEGVRGSGLPLLAGLVRPGELQRCDVDHALAISLPGVAAGRFVQPASATDGTDTRRDAVPAGARLRLRADVRLADPVDPDTGQALPFTSARRGYAGCLVRALRTYGAFVVGRASVPTLHLERMTPRAGRAPLLNGYELQSLGLGDFEVLDLRDRAVYPYPVDVGTSR